MVICLSRLIVMYQIIIANIWGNRNHLLVFNNTAVVEGRNRKCFFNFYFWHVDEWLVVQIRYLVLALNWILSVFNRFQSYFHILLAWGSLRVCFWLVVSVDFDDRPRMLIWEPENSKAAVSEDRQPHWIMAWRHRKQKCKYAHVNQRKPFPTLTQESLLVSRTGFAPSAELRLLEQCRWIWHLTESSLGTVWAAEGRADHRHSE